MNWRCSEEVNVLITVEMDDSGGNEESGVPIICWKKSHFQLIAHVIRTPCIEAESSEASYRIRAPSTRVKHGFNAASAKTSS